MPVSRHEVRYQGVPHTTASREGGPAFGSLLPNGVGGRVVVTSRSDEWDGEAYGLTNVRVGPLEKDEADAVFAAVVGRSAGAADEADDAGEREAWSDLAERLGYYPLILGHLAARAREDGACAADLSDKCGMPRDGAPSSPSEDAVVAALLKDSLEAIEARHGEGVSVARHVLWACAHFQADAIPTSLLGRFVSSCREMCSEKWPRSLPTSTVSNMTTIHLSPSHMIP